MSRLQLLDVVRSQQASLRALRLRVSELEAQQRAPDSKPKLERADTRQAILSPQLTIDSYNESPSAQPSLSH
jgi:hypothetical protein